MYSPPQEVPIVTADAPAQPGMEQRTQPDRRKEPTRPWKAFLRAGRRIRNRRADEDRRPYFVDRFSPGMLLCVLALVVASLVDAVLTIHVLRAGGIEINPVMDRLLNHSVEAFVIVKYVLTVTGLPLLLVFKNHYLFGTRVRVGHLITAAVALYCVLIGYQAALIYNYIGL